MSMVVAFKYYYLALMEAIQPNLNGNLSKKPLLYFTKLNTIVHSGNIPYLPPLLDFFTNFLVWTLRPFCGHKRISPFGDSGGLPNFEASR